MLVPPLAGTYSTVADAFEVAAGQFADRAAFIDGSPKGERLRFAEWHRRADACAHHLVGRGVLPGDVVAIMLPSSIDYAIVHAAIALAGGVATGINPRLGEREVRSVLDRCRPVVAVIDRDAFDVELPSSCVAVERPELVEIYGGQPLGDARPRCAPTDAAVIIWTSGTTGVPKGAWFDHRNLHAAVASAGIMSRPFDVRLVGLPFAHAGFMAKMWDHIAWATTVVIAPTPWHAADMARLLVDESVTIAGAVPTQWAKLLDEPGIDQLDLSHLRLGLAATAPSSPELIERVATSIGCPLVVRYAMTESPSITGTEPDDDPEVQFRTVGQPQAGMEIQIVDPDGGPVPVGEVGLVRIRGACVMRGYWADDELTQSTISTDGWLTSSDLARFDDDGNLLLVGRASDMYIRGGYNVYPLEVENVLAEHSAVERAAVVGTPAPTIGEIGVAFVVAANAGTAPSLADLRAFVSDRLADYKAPDRLVILDALPLTAMMKIDKVELARHATDTTDERMKGAR